MSYLDPRTYYLYLNAGTTPPPPPQQTDFGAQYVIQPGVEEFTVPHSLGTADVVPCFTPSWNTVVWPVEITSAYVRARLSVPAPQRAATMDFSVARGTTETVTPVASSKTITHNLGDATAVVLFAANWNTTIKIVSKAANSTDLQFNTRAPAAGGLIYYATHADVSDITSTETVLSGAETHTITHGAGRSFLPIYLVPYWNTVITWFRKDSLDETIVKFSTPPGGTTSMDTRVKGIGNMVSS